MNKTNKMMLEGVARVMFHIKIDSSRCISLVEGIHKFDKVTYDCFKYGDFLFHSGKIYGIISEYGQGCMYLSYLLGGKVEFQNLQILLNDKEVVKEDLASISWNLEPSKEKYKNEMVKKSIDKALGESGRGESFDEIAKKFILTRPRYSRKLIQLSGERWRASAALGYAKEKKIFYAPYNTSEFYYQMSQSGLIKVLRNLTEDGAIVLLPSGSDVVLKHLVDKCVYLDREYDFENLKRSYSEMFGEGNWVK